MKKRTSKKRKADAAGKQTKPPRQRDLGPPPEAFEGLDAWAADVAKCVTSEELGLLIGIYKKTANNPKVSAANRRLARKQAEALRKIHK